MLFKIFKLVDMPILSFLIVIVITFCLPSFFGQGKGHFGLRVKLPPGHLSTTHGGGFTLSLSIRNFKQGSFEYQILQYLV